MENSNSWNGLKVMVIDDSHKARAELVETYRRLGLQVCGEAENGYEALMALDSGEMKPDLLSIDIIMPEMDGVELNRKLVEKYPDIKKIFVSYLASDRSAALSLAQTLGSEAIARKPINQAELKAVLDLAYDAAAGISSAT